MYVIGQFEMTLKVGDIAPLRSKQYFFDLHAPSKVDETEVAVL